MGQNAGHNAELLVILVSDMTCDILPDWRSSPRGRHFSVLQRLERTTWSVHVSPSESRPDFSAPWGASIFLPGTENFPGPYFSSAFAEAIQENGSWNPSATRASIISLPHTKTSPPKQCAPLATVPGRDTIRSFSKAVQMLVLKRPTRLINIPPVLNLLQGKIVPARGPTGFGTSHHDTQQ